jgi:hypothetical protein
MNNLMFNLSQVVPFYCNKCKFACSKQSIFNKHLLTKKHIFDLLNKNQESIEIQEYQNLEKDQDLICICGKEYADRTGLYRHNKICKYIQELNLSIPNELTSALSIEQLLIEQNKNQIELLVETKKTNENQNKTQELLIEQNNLLKNQKPNNITNNNNKFNLNIYLNETCKDAINIGDFVSQLQLTMADFENFATLGYVQNISNIFIRQLKLLDKTKRPILCSDSKREVIYIKDQNVWEKDENNQKTIKTIKKIARDNTKQSDNWLIANPKYYQYDSKENTKHSLIMNEAMGGNTTEDDAKNYDKIVRNVIKEVTVSK